MAICYAQNYMYSNALKYFVIQRNRNILISFYAVSDTGQSELHIVMVTKEVNWCHCCGIKCTSTEMCRSIPGGKQWQKWKTFFFEASYLKITKEMYLMLASTCKLACTAILKDIVYPLFYFCPFNPFGWRN